MISRSQLKGRSKDQLRGRWGLAIGVVLAGLILMSGFNIGVNLKRTYDSAEQIGIVPSVNSGLFLSATIFANLWALVLSGVFSLGMKIFLINFTTGRNQAGIRNLFEGFRYEYISRIDCIYRMYTINNSWNYFCTYVFSSFLHTGR